MMGVEALAVSARLRVAARRYGAASFACQKLAWFTEPKLAEVRERRLVDQIFTSWNLLISWLRRIDGLRDPA